MSEPVVLAAHEGPVGLIRLNRPEVLNALNSEVMEALAAVLTDWDHDDGVRVAVLTGSERAFAAGADIAEMKDQGAAEMLRSPQLTRWEAIRRFSKPLIGAVSGWALGGGMELAMCCDLLVASETARFGQPEITIGVIPGAGGTQRLTRAVGKAIAMEMVLNNRTLTAAEALQFGLVNRVVPVDRCLDEALALAAELAGRAPLAVRLAKEAVNKAFELPLSEALEAERRAFYMLFATQDQKEGMQAFIEKRKPNWQGK